MDKLKKNVVHITTVHHPYDTRIYYKECISLYKAGYNVTLIAPEIRGFKKDKVNIIPIKKYRNRLLRMFLTTVQAYKKARDIKADYYHIHDPELLPVARILKKDDNVVIYDIHEDYETSILQKKYIIKPIRKIVALSYRVVERILTRKLELCLAEKYYKRKYPKGICILNYPILNDKITSLQIEQKQNKNLIYTGNVTIDRGALLHASLPLIDTNVSVHFVGKCDSRLANQMYDIAGSRKNQLFIKGIDRFVPREEIDNQYISHDWLAGLALFPPTDHYRQKELTKFFEYMMAGIPILCSDFPVWKRFVEKYACGIAVNPLNELEIKCALKYLKENPKIARKMGENGRKAVQEKLNWQLEEKKLIKWYSDIWRRT